MRVIAETSPSYCWKLVADRLDNGASQWWCGCQPASAQGPTFAERRAVADLDRHAKAIPIHLNPERVGSVVSDIVTVGILRGEHGSRFIRREHMAAHVALGIAMLF